MTKFVHGLFQESLAKQIIIAVKAVELLTQPMNRNDGAGPPDLGFSENVFKDRDVKIDVGNREETPFLRPHQRLHALQDFRGMILLALGVVTRSGVENVRNDLAIHVETPR